MNFLLRRGWQPEHFTLILPHLFSSLDSKAQRELLWWVTTSVHMRCCDEWMYICSYELLWWVTIHPSMSCCDEWMYINSLSYWDESLYVYSVNWWWFTLHPFIEVMWWFSLSVHLSYYDDSRYVCSLGVHKHFRVWISETGCWVEYKLYGYVLLSSILCEKIGFWNTQVDCPNLKHGMDSLYLRAVSLFIFTFVHSIVKWIDQKLDRDVNVKCCSCDPVPIIEILSGLYFICMVVPKVVFEICLFFVEGRDKKSQLNRVPTFFLCTLSKTLKFST